MTKQQSGKKVYLWYTLLFAAVVCIAFFPFVYKGRTFIRSTDGFLQYYVYFVKFRDMVGDLLSGGGLELWNWESGLGADMLGNYVLVFSDPFNYLALLFPRRYIDVAYSLIVVLKMYGAGICMMLYLGYHKKQAATRIIGALSFGICAWSLGSFGHAQFLLQMIWFPLLILGVDKIWDQKSPLTLILATALSLAGSRYFSYMSAIFVAIYIVMRYFADVQKKTVKGFFICLFKYLGYAVIGVLLSMPLLIPCMYVMSHTSTSSGVEIPTFLTMKQTMKFFPALAGMYEINGKNSFSGQNALIVAMIPAMIPLWKQKKVPVTMFFITLLTAALPVLQSVLNGFSYPVGRWCYVLAFFFVYAGAECLESPMLQTKKCRIAVAAWLLALFGYTTLLTFHWKILSKISYLLIALNLTFGAAAYLILYVKGLPQAKRMTVLACAVAANIAAVPFVRYLPSVSGFLGNYMEQGRCYEIFQNNSIKAATKIADGDFFRTDYVGHENAKGTTVPYSHQMANVNVFWEVPSVFQYRSTVDKNWLEFNNLLDNSSGYSRRVCVFSNDNRSRIDFLLGVKYFLGDNANKEEQLSQYAGYAFAPSEEIDGVSVLKSKYDAALGYVFEQVISETEFLKFTEPEREQVLMQSAQVTDEAAKKITLASKADMAALKTQVEDVPYTVRAGEGAEVSEQGIKITEKNAEVTFTATETVKNSEVYLRFEDFQRESHAYGNFMITVESGDVKKRLFNMEGQSAQAITDIEDYMVNLGYTEEGSPEITCTFETTGMYRFDSIKILAIPQESFDTQAQKLENNRLTITEKKKNMLTGHIDTENGGLLYLSIPYDLGWSYYVDGEKAENVYRVNTAFTGIEVPAGAHEITMRYYPMGLNLGLAMFAVGVALTVVAVMRAKKEKGTLRSR